MIKKIENIIHKLEKFTGLPIKYFIKFAMVGSAGILVNMGLFYILNTQAKLNYKISSIISIETSILFNFFINTIWTWRDRKQSGKKHSVIRFLKYHLITLISGIINYGILVLLVDVFSLNKYIANLTGILIASGINFILNHLWTFKKIDAADSVS